jgi:hypothetical protein
MQGACNAGCLLCEIIVIYKMLVIQNASVARLLDP